VIRKRGKGWVLLTKNGKKVLGRHRTKAAAERQERAVKAAKKRRRKRR
jgi:hypothetical protein